MNSINKLGTVLVGVAVLYGCGGGGSGGSSSAPATATGVLVDAPVGGVTYVTESNNAERVTNAQGEFNYVQGETVSFSVGGIALGEVLGDSLITPLELLGTSVINDEVVNMAQFLQSLDNDGDPDNGIDIPTATIEALKFSAISFDSPSFDTEVQSVFDTVFTESPVTLVSNGVAQSHLEDTFFDLRSENPNGFTTEQLVGTTFYFLGDASDFDTDDEAESTYEIVFNEDGNGTIGLFDSVQTNPIEWLVKADGRLTFTETGSGGDVFNLTISVTGIDGDFINVSWSETRTEGGVDGTGSGSGKFYTEARYPGYQVDLTTRVAASVVTSSACTTYTQTAGFDYTFTSTTLNREGSDNIDENASPCSVGESEEQSFVMAELSQDFDLPFNCVDYPICDFRDLNKMLTGSSEGQTTTATYTHVPGSNIITYTVEYQPDNRTITEVITLGDSLGDLPQGFQQIELAGQTFFNAYADDGLNDQYVIQELSFDVVGNGMTDDGESGTYEVTSDGVLILDFGDEQEFIGLLEIIDENQFTTCWGDSVGTSSSCAGLSIEHFFTSEISAHAFANEKNNNFAFTSSELEDFTFYFALLEPEDCGSSWVVEEMTFNTNGYSLDVCGQGLGNEVDEPFVLLDSGAVQLVNFGEFANRVGFDAELQAYLVCWEDTEQAALSCSEEEQGLAFLSQSDAQAYVDEQNDLSENLVE